MKIIVVGETISAKDNLRKLMEILEATNKKVPIIVADSIPEGMHIEPEPIQFTYTKGPDVPMPFIDRTPPWKRKKYF